MSINIDKIRCITKKGCVENEFENGMDTQELQQVVGELDFPAIFAFVPWLRNQSRHG